MSLCISISGPEGVVLAADTRLTLTRGEHTVSFDNASKLLHVGDKVAAAVYGTASIGTQPIHTFVPAFKRAIPGMMKEDGRNFLPIPGVEPPLTVEEYANYLVRFFRGRWQAVHGEQPPGTSFLVAGVSPGKPHGERYRINNLGDPDSAPSFGLSWGGQLGTVGRLIKGFDFSLFRYIAAQYPEEDIAQHFKQWDSQTNVTLPYDSMPLQDCVDLAVLLTETTIKLQALSVTSRGVGGEVEVITITPEGGTEWVRRRKTSGHR